MKAKLFSIAIALAIVSANLLNVACSSCTQSNTNDSIAVDSDSIRAVVEAERIANTPFTDKQQPSVDAIDYSVTIFDTVTSGELKSLKCLYDNSKGSYTFRGNPMRTADYGGRVKGNPTEIVEVWRFKTDYDGTHTSMGTWGGGTGWTGQPVYVKWDDEQMKKFREQSPALTEAFDNEEIILGSLCCKAYFINFKTGEASRKPLDVINPIKGSVSLDPTLNGNLYVGHGIPKVNPMSQMAFNLFTHQQTFFSGKDVNARVSWCAYDSSPVRVDQFLFWPGENGTLYKYKIDGDKLVKHSTLRFNAKGDGAAGTENSICIYKNYGFYGTNHGDVICVNLNTMKPIWHYDNHDDIDASIVCEVVDDVPYLYCGCEVDRQGDTGTCHFVKLNGLTGKQIWETTIPCKKLNMGGKHFDGGLYSTPLIGRGDCDGLLFANICQRDNSSRAEFTAFDKKTGEIVYRTPLKTFAWSSPVGFLNEKGKQYIFAGDASGFAYLIDGKTGEIIFNKLMVCNFESSPVVVGNQLVVGSRGNTIHKFEIR